MEGYFCFICTELKHSQTFIQGPVNNLASHLRNIHNVRTSSNKVSGIPLVCSQNGCEETFSYFCNFSYHIKKCSKNWKSVAIEVEEVVIQNQTPSSENLNLSIDHDTNMSDHSPDVQDDIPCDDIVNNFAKFMLNLKSEHLVSNSALDYIANNLGNIFSEVMGDSEHCVKSILKQFNSQEKRLQFYKRHFRLVEPETIFISHSETSVVRINCHGESILKRKSNTFQYISLRSTLSILFGNADFRKKFYGEVENCNGFMESHRDTNNFKSSDFFKRFPFAIRFQLFFDETEVTNPLGSKTKKHELGMFCYRIENLPPVENSRLVNIHPLVVSHSKDLKSSDFKFIADKIFTEMSLLESDEGMLLDVPDMPGFRVHGTISSICGDTKGMHELFGFSGPSSNKFCRLCLIHRDEIRKISRNSDLRMRTRENYEEHVQQANLTNGESIPSTGVKFSCQFNRSIHLSGDNQILDCMHDFLEGVVSFIVMLVLRHFATNDKYKLSAKELNRRLKKFAYSYYDLKNKPSPRFTDPLLRQEKNYNTKQRASQNWCLISILPLLLGDLIDIDDPYFELILILNRIMNIVFSPTIALEHTIVLEEHIRQMFLLFNQLFPSVNPINKFHHMVHYPAIIRENGPPMRYWCMRYEAYHNICKRVAHVNCNFKNIAKSVAMHLQTVSCAAILNDYLFHSNDFILGPIDRARCEVPFPVGFKLIKWVKFQGREYRFRSVIVIRHSYVTECGFPKFGIIQKIAVNERKLIFDVRSCRTVRFDDHFHSFEIDYDSNDELLPLNFDDVPDCEPFWIVQNFKVDDNRLFVSPKRWV